MSAPELTDDELTRVICAVRNHGDVSQWYELVPRCYTQCGWVGRLETAPNGGPRKEQFAAHWQEQVANELRPIVAARVRRALEDAADYALAVDRDGEAASPDATGLWDNAHAALTDVLMNRGAAQQIHEWLRDRAAGYDPRETKD